MRTKIAAACVAILAAAACNPDVTASPAEEMVLAQQVQAIAENELAASQAGYANWLGRLVAALRTTDNPAAQACLAEARALRAEARAAFATGDRELARDLLHESFLKVLCAVVEVFPEAAERSGEVVDRIVGRIEERLGTREAPRIRAILEHVAELREQAETALAGGNKIGALALNLRALEILHRLVDHIRDVRHDHNNVADERMANVDF